MTDELKPVAWMYERDGRRMYTSSPAADIFVRNTGWAETPIYTADQLEALQQRVRELEEALGEIARDSNPDWTEKRVYPNDVLDDIHTIAVRAYYKVKL